VDALVSALRTQAAVRGAKYARSVAKRKAPRPRYPHKEVLIYHRKIRYIVAQAQYVIQRDLIPQLPTLLDEQSQTPQTVFIRRDSADDIDRAIAKTAAATAQAIPEREIEQAATQTALRVSEWHADELGRQVEKVARINLHDNPTGLAGAIDLFVSDNVALIKSINVQQLEQVKGVILRGARAGKHHLEVRDEIVAQFGKSNKRAAVIARDQVGKLNGQLTQLRQTNIGIKRYRWSSSQDERVRSGHRKLNGTIQEWSKPPLCDERTGERAHPGYPVQCRCVAIPIVDDLLVEAGLLDPEDVELQQPTPGPAVKVPGPRTPANTQQPPATPITPTPPSRPPPAPLPPTPPPPAPPPVTRTRPPPGPPVSAALPKPVVSDPQLEAQAFERLQRQLSEALQRKAAAQVLRKRAENALAAALASSERQAVRAAQVNLEAAFAAEAAASAAYGRAATQAHTPPVPRPPTPRATPPAPMRPPRRPGGGAARKRPRRKRPAPPPTKPGLRRKRAR
jgi:SPP1 gp7 family putative phage head morphogenesis protein